MQFPNVLRICRKWSAISACLPLLSACFATSPTQPMLPEPPPSLTKPLRPLPPVPTLQKATSVSWRGGFLMSLEYTPNAETGSLRGPISTWA